VSLRQPAEGNGKSPLEGSTAKPGGVLFVKFMTQVQDISKFRKSPPIWAAGIFVMVPVIQFFSTPLFTLIGIYTYYSPMVVSLGSNNRVIDLHNGTSFDYLLEMRHVKPGLPWKKRMLGHYLAALQHIIDKIEYGELPSSVTVQGSSYFLSRSSAERLGFSVSGTSVFVKFNILLNYLDLL
jgi:hypothetical protein